METDTGPTGSEAERIAVAQRDWLKDILLQIGPKKVRVGVVYMTLALFLEQGLHDIEESVKYKLRGLDDDIPF